MGHPLYVSRFVLRKGHFSSYLLSWSLVEHFAQHFQTFQLRKTGEVQAVVFEDEKKDALPLRAGEGKELHRTEVHAHELGEGFGFLSGDVVTMGGGNGAKLPTEQVEVG